MTASTESVPTGLTSAEAAARLRADGPNELPAVPPPPAWRLLLDQMVHFFALMLWIAGALAWIAGMPQLAVAIVFVIVVNALFAFGQEYRAERAAERLRDLLPRRTTVLRDGVTLEIDARELVRGDLVQLAAGDRISADLRAVAGHALSVDTSLLTGESVPEAAGAGDALYAGTFLVNGEGQALVTATGTSTRLAGIAGLVRATRRPPSPLQREIDRVVRIVAGMALGVGTGFFLVSLLVGTSLSDGLLFAIGVTVALVPEGLLPTVTLSLAIGAQRMARRNALVRRLESVETLGSTTFICTDKTGTLTRNEMNVVRVWTPAGETRVHGEGYAPAAEIVADPAALAAARHAALVADRCSNGRAVEELGAWVARGDPMEAAIDALARRLAVDTLADERDRPERARYAFDPDRRRMSILAGGQLLVKGAPETVLPRCGETHGADSALELMARDGLRVIAVAERAFPGTLPASPEAAERELTLLALLGLQDPPRAHARDALAACRAAGIRVAMLTGDHPATAEAIAREVGLLADPALVVAGHDLPADDALLGALLDRDGVVVARVTPEDKLRIARVLRERGHVVAMTGDGVNDGPALQQANIGIAMGRSGTDVAREAADLVLLDDDFATIVEAIRQGRATYTNIGRFLTYHLTDNVAELTPFVIWALSGGRFPLALGVLQILMLDLVTDALPALALGTEPPSPRALDRPPHHRHLLNGDTLRRVFGVLGPVEALVEMTAFLATFVALGWRPGDPFTDGDTLLAASGAAFSAVVVGQLANSFACRSATLPPWQLGWTTNRLLLGAAAFQLLALAVLLFVPPVADLLDHAVPTATGWLVALLAIPAVLVADTLWKRRGVWNTE